MAKKKKLKIGKKLAPAGKSDALLLIIVFILPFVIFWQTTGFEFVWDDNAVHLTKNPYFNPPKFSHLLHFWAAPYQRLYIPVAYTVWGGLKMIGLGTSFFLHLLNIFFHSLNGILVFFLIRQFINNRLAVVAGTLIFLVHPIQVESVAWVSEFRGLFAGFWGLLSILYYIKFCRIKYKSDPVSLLDRYLIAALIFYVAGLLTKPSIIIVPLFAVLMEYYLFRPSLKQIAQTAWPFMIPVIIFILLTSAIQSNAPLSPLWARPLIWMDSTLFYLKKLFFPVALCAIYSRTPSMIMEQEWFYFSWLLLLCAGIIIWRFKKKQPLLILSGLLFIAGFLPVSGLIPFTFQSWSTVADRYLYMSMLGVALAGAVISTCLNQTWQKILPAVLIASLAGFSGFHQVSVWKNDVTLMSNCIKNYPSGVRPYAERGKAYLMMKNYHKAGLDFNKTISLAPDSPIGYLNRAKLYIKQKEYDKAIADYNSAISLHSEKPIYFINRGIVYFLQQKFASAITDFNHAITLDQKSKQAYYWRGTAYFYMNEYHKALTDIMMSQNLGKRIDQQFLKEVKIKANHHR